MMKSNREDLEPNWIGLEPVTEISNPHEFFDQLIREDPAESILKRGYAVIKLSESLKKSYASFAVALDAFCDQSIDNKAKFATKFDSSTFSPNQFHGYSRMEGLKEQYMIRASGKGQPMLFPGSYTIPGTETLSPNFGIKSLELFEDLDQSCRQILHKVCDKMKLPYSKADNIVDTINQVTKTGQNYDIQVTPTEHGQSCSTSYMVPGFVSSSLLDVFKYGNTFTKEDGSYDKFKNNHSSHTDSGILTLVPVTDVPGLEVFDQRLNTWIALEKIIHNVVDNHRDYGTIFWGDSVEYLTKEAKACLHRVEKANVARFSIVFKMRTTPTTTAPRYQEDYALADLQLKALSAWKGNNNTLTIMGVAVAAYIVYLLTRNNKT